MGGRLREDLIHVAVRKFLKKDGWTPIAGQFPNGSDDEVAPLNIVDPRLARDQSPDHRRHSLNKLVPDLISLRAASVLIIEFKPTYSESDEEKLLTLFSDRRDDLVGRVVARIKKLGLDSKVDLGKLQFIPALGFSSDSKYPPRPDFAYFEVSGLDDVKAKGKYSAN